MICSQLQRQRRNFLSKANRTMRGFLVLFALLIGLGCWGPSTALAGIDDDRYDGNIFALYASNGSLVPPKVNLAQALQKHRPALLMFYADDSRECKQNALIITQLQAFYRQNVNLIPISVDTIASNRAFASTEAPYYYNGSLVPQFVLFDPSGDIVLDHIGQIPYEPIDDLLRGMFDLPARPDSFSIERPAYSPSPTADTTFWTAPVRAMDQN